ncbi:GntR family transcriptional regulator [Sporosarcina limicola]|uniref:DNA-binding GntR family transcriptional regulator n=1 Tax=Sporosarcina limicola TaxID=34101 RepID=A0A927MJV6_9BACL|nr:GntR family transcriptional regulator [Sporosarcina limicola]MBE1555268.1 DNA-binding GntR family transcriptional regulator [Sporosarcina limicola]
MEKIIKSKTLAEQAYSLLKKEIISGELEPGTGLREEKLASKLGLSRTPLREAIRRLAMEELVVLNKGKPATVATFTKEESLEFMELRRMLEIYNIEKIIFNEDTFFIRELEENLQRQMEAISNDDFQEYIDIDREFHLILASQNDNGKMRELIHLMNTGVNRAFLVLSNTVHMSAKGAYEEHLRIVNALKYKNFELAVQEMKEHLINVEKRFLVYFKGEEER